MNKLALRKETLADLSAAELREVAGGSHESHSCTPTYTGSLTNALNCDSLVCTRAAQPTQVEQVVAVVKRIGC